MRRSLLVIGQSHIAAIRAAARVRREADPCAPQTRVIHTLEPRYAPELVADESAFAAPLMAAIRDQTERHRPHIVSCIGGNVHNVMGLIRHPRPFDVRLTPHDVLGQGIEPLTQGLLRATLTHAMSRDLVRLRLLAALSGSLIHLESPPPLQDDALILDRADAFFRDHDLIALGVAPAGLRHRLWKLHGMIMRDACAEAGIRFVPIPEIAQDEDGYLHPTFAADATHGNALYGEAVIQQIEAYLDHISA
jgi:hypothetical protein